METIQNVVASAKETIIGKDETAEQAQKSGTEPAAGVKGEGASSTEPYDKGNLETPLRNNFNPLDSPSAAAHTNPNPTSATTDDNAALAPNAAPTEAGGDATAPTPASVLPGSQPAAASALADAAANVKADAESTPSKAADGPTVGTAKDVSADKPLEAKTEETAPGEAGTGVTSPAEAEKAIHAEAKKVEAEAEASEKAGAAVEKKEEVKGKAAEAKEAAKEKAVDAKEKVVAKEKGTEASPAPSSKSDKKKLSTRIKEKLHIGKKAGE